MVLCKCKSYDTVGFFTKEKTRGPAPELENDGAHTCDYRELKFAKAV